MATMITERLRRGRAVALVSAALAGSALAVAGCGGDGDSGSTAGAVASYVPSSSPMYLEVSTDFDGPQWTQVEALAKVFPGYPEFQRMIDEGLRSGDVDFETEVRPLLGDRAAVAALSLPDAAEVQGTLTSPSTDGAAKAADDQEFVAVVEIAEGKQDAVKALLVKGGATPQGEHEGVEYYGDRAEDTVIAVDEGAAVISDTPEQVFVALDAHEAGGDKTLAGTDKFNDALGKLPEDVFGQAYLDVGAFIQQAGAASPQLSQAGLGDYQNAVMAASISAEPEGGRLKGVVVGAPDAGLSEFTPALVDRVPADALAYLGFHDLSGTIGNIFEQIQGSLGDEEREQVDTLRDQLPQMLGVSLEDLSALTAGEQAIVVTSGAKAPGAALAMQVEDGARASATLDKLRVGVPQLLKSFSPDTALPAWQQVPLGGGVQGWRLPLSPEAGVVYGVDGDIAVVASSVQSAGGVLRPVAPLSGAAPFQEATNGMPEQVTSLFWLNLEQGVDALRNAGAFEDAPAGTLANLRPFKSVAAWTTAGEMPTFEVFLGISG
jgi:hypothetical protein